MNTQSGKPKYKLPLWLIVLAIIVTLAAKHLNDLSAPPATHSPSQSSTDTNSAPNSSLPDSSLLNAIRNRASDVIIQGSGVITKVLPDDNEGSRHQRMILRLSTGETVLIAHNIDVAKRVKANEGERIEFKGEFIWNNKGGLVHWTHQDPAKRHPAGWIRANGVQYD